MYFSVDAKMHVELGTRIVRGLDWIWGDQDGEEGMLGTVVQIKNDHPPAGSVKVLWDHGGQGMYRCGENNACDLLVFCSPAGKSLRKNLKLDLQIIEPDTRLDKRGL